MTSEIEKDSELSLNAHLFQELVYLAESTQRTDVLESFRDYYIAACLEKFSNNTLATWEALVDAVDMDDTLREVERTMNQCYFIHILKSSGMMISGQDRTGRPILWFQTPSDSFRISAKSPEADAFIRAIVWSTEISSLKANSCLVIIDDRSRSMLDFNLPLSHDMCKYLARRNPAENNSILLFGAHPVLRPAWNVFSQLGVPFAKNMKFVASADEIYGIVKNHDDIPEWWLGKGKGKRTSLCRNNLWEWERCLGKGETTVRAKEIFNPKQPWEDIDEEVSDDTETAVQDKYTQGLGTIPEEEDGSSCEPCG
jgi:hypothetical protein